MGSSASRVFEISSEISTISSSETEPSVRSTVRRSICPIDSPPRLNVTSSTPWALRMDSQVARTASATSGRGRIGSLNQDVPPFTRMRRMRRIWDISLPISPDMLTWPGDPPVRIEPAHRIARGDAANVSEIHMGTHTGTHVDPPHHFLDGASTVESLPLDVLMGDAVVVEV